MTDSINLTGGGKGGKRGGIAESLGYNLKKGADANYPQTDEARIARAQAREVREANKEFISALRSIAQVYNLRKSTEDQQARQIREAQKSLISGLHSSIKAYNYRKKVEENQDREKKKAEKEVWNQLSLSAKVYKLRNNTLKKQYETERREANWMNADFNAKQTYQRKQQREAERRQASAYKMRVALGSEYGPFPGRQPKHYGPPKPPKLEKQFGLGYSLSKGEGANYAEADSRRGFAHSYADARRENADFNARQTYQRRQQREAERRQKNEDREAEQRRYRQMRQTYARGAGFGPFLPDTKAASAAGMDAQRRQAELYRVQVANGNAYGPFVGAQPSHYLYKPGSPSPRQPGAFGTAGLGIAKLLGGRPFATAARQLFYPGSGGDSGGGGGVDAGGLAVLLRGGAGAAFAYEAAKLVASAASPSAYSSRASSYLGAAAPYHNLQIGAAEMGRQGGFSGSALANTIYSRGRLSPELTGTGITSAEQAMNLLRTYGTVSSPNEAMNVLGDMGTGYLTNGLSLERNAQLLSMSRELGITAPYDRPGESGNGFNAFGGNKYKSRTEFMQTMSKAVAVGSAAGLDASKTSSVIENMLRATISGGGASASIDSSASMFSRFANSGLAAGRTGEAQMNLIAGNIASASQVGYGGTPLQNTGHLMWYKKKFGPNGPTSAKDLAAGYGVDYENATQVEKDQIDDAFARAQKGDIAGVAQKMQPFLKSHPEVSLEIAKTFASTAPASLRATAGAAYMNMDELQYRAALAGTDLNSDSGTYLSYKQGNAGVNNKNYLNLKAPGENAPFRKFDSVRQGLAASYQQLLIDQQRDKKFTVRQLAQAWHGGDSMPSDYVSTIAKAMGVDPDAPIDLSDKDTAIRYLRGASRAETGYGVDPNDARAAVSAVLGGTNNPTTSGGNNILGDQTQANNAIMKGSENAANTKILSVNQGFDVLTDAVNATTRALDSFINSLKGQGPAGAIPRLNLFGSPSDSVIRP